MKKSLNNKNILFLPRWYPSQTDSMLGLFVLSHAKAAIEAGFGVTVAFVSPAVDSMVERYEASMVQKGNLCEVVIYYNNHQLLSPLWKRIAWLKAIRLAIRENGKPDLVHAHVLTRMAWLAWITAKWYHVPYVITEHWSRYFPENDQYKGFWRKKLTQCLVSGAGVVSVVSKRLEEAMHHQGLKFDAWLLPNVVDTHLFNIKPHHNTAFRFVNVSCFEDKSKNLRLLLDAAHILWEQHQDFELTLVGDGADKQAIEEYAKKIGVKYPLTFTGMLKQEETAQIVQQSDCLVLSSNYETFGIVVFEALACGIPAVVTDVADYKEHITKEYGIVVPVGDARSLAAAMGEMYRQKDAFDPLKLRDMVVDFCSKESVSIILNRMYKQVLK